MSRLPFLWHKTRFPGGPPAEARIYWDEPRTRGFAFPCLPAIECHACQVGVSAWYVVSELNLRPANEPADWRKEFGLALCDLCRVAAENRNGLRSLGSPSLSDMSSDFPLPIHEEF